MPENPNTLYETTVRLSENEEAELELATLKTRDNFETYFTEDVTDIRAITYSDSLASEKNRFPWYSTLGRSTLKPDEVDV